MDLNKFEKHLESLSDAELAKLLAKNIGQYKNTVMDMETTMSIPDLDSICMMANELSKRLSS